MSSEIPSTGYGTQTGQGARRADRPWPVLLLYGPLVISVAAAMASALSDAPGRLPNPARTGAPGEVPLDGAEPERFPGLFTDASVPGRRGPSALGLATHDPPGR
ncbi:MAG: hypothetical protein AAFP22_07215 [Planctomycetota bacterium]